MKIILKYPIFTLTLLTTFTLLFFQNCGDINVIALNSNTPPQTLPDIKAVATKNFYLHGKLHTNYYFSENFVNFNLVLENHECAARKITTIYNKNGPDNYFSQEVCTSPSGGGATTLSRALFSGATGQLLSKNSNTEYIFTDSNIDQFTVPDINNDGWDEVLLQKADGTGFSIVSGQNLNEILKSVIYPDSFRYAEVLKVLQDKNNDGQDDFYILRYEAEAPLALTQKATGFIIDGATFDFNNPIYQSTQFVNTGSFVYLQIAEMPLPNNTTRNFVEFFTYKIRLISGETFSALREILPTEIIAGSSSFYFSSILPNQLYKVVQYSPAQINELKLSQTDELVFKTFETGEYARALNNEELSTNCNLEQALPVERPHSSNLVSVACTDGVRHILDLTKSNKVIQIDFLQGIIFPAAPNQISFLSKY